MLPIFISSFLCSRFRRVLVLEETEQGCAAPASQDPDSCGASSPGLGPAACCRSRGRSARISSLLTGCRACMFAWLPRSPRAICAPSSLFLPPLGEHTILRESNFLFGLVLYLPIERSVLFLGCPVSCWDSWALLFAPLLSS